MTAPVSVGRRHVLLGEDRREYELRRTPRRTLAITVEPGGALVVTAPSLANESRIDAALRKHRSWIRRQLRDAEALPPRPVAHEWVSGETHRYLGRQYRLNVSRGGESDVKLAGRYFRVVISARQNDNAVRDLMARWYLQRAREQYLRRLSMHVSTQPRLRITRPPELMVRKLANRWGSCTTQGRIVMNVDAVRLPMPCVDYLIVHELCHLRQPNHGPAFWRLLESCMPDWERWRQRLHSAEI